MRSIRDRSVWLGMLRAVSSNVALAVAVLVGACGAPPGAVVCDMLVEDPAGLLLDPVIAHAAGTARGVHRSNSLEALEASACPSEPCFVEVDIALTRDDWPALIHDWDDTARRMFAREGRPSLAAFLDWTMRDGLTQVDLERLAAWMARYPTATVVVDPKGADPVGVLVQIAAYHPELVPRMVPELFALADYDTVRHLGYRHVILSLYRLAAEEETLLRFVETHEVLGIAMPTDDPRVDLPRHMLERGIPTWVHTVERPSEMAALRARCVYGFFSDTQDTLPASLDVAAPADEEVEA